MEEKFLNHYLVQYVPGAQYIFSKKSGFFQKIFWTVAILASVGGLCYYMTVLYYKWNIAPDIATKSKIRASSDIPFPAVTICSSYFPIRFQHEPVNPVSKMIEYVRQQKNASHFTKDEINSYPLLVHLCGPLEKAHQLKDLFRNREQINYVRHLMTMRSISEFKMCSFQSKFTACPFIFNLVLTEYGYCHSFNMQGFTTIFNVDGIDPAFNSYQRFKMVEFPYPLSNFSFNYVDDYNETVRWTLDGEYTNTDDEMLPVRAIKKNKLSIALEIFRRSPHFCYYHGRGFRLIMHLPNEMPTMFHQQLFVKEGFDTNFKITAELYKASSNLRRYSPAIRRCYFKGEKALKFFKPYTKRHCDFECITNHTLNLCGCVKFSMPRIKETHVCEIEHAECYYEAMKNCPKVEHTDENSVLVPCDCYPSCNDIKYSFSADRDAPVIKKFNE